jgi:hypothetical protein
MMEYGTKADSLSPLVEVVASLPVLSSGVLPQTAMIEIGWCVPATMVMVRFFSLYGKVFEVLDSGGLSRNEKQVVFSDRKRLTSDSATLVLMRPVSSNTSSGPNVYISRDGDVGF